MTKRFLFNKAERALYTAVDALLILPAAFVFIGLLLASNLNMSDLSLLIKDVSTEELFEAWIYLSLFFLVIKAVSSFLDSIFKSVGDISYFQEEVVVYENKDPIVMHGIRVNDMGKKWFFLTKIDAMQAKYLKEIHKEDK